MVWYFKPFDVTIPHVFYACIGAFVVLFGMFSLFVREKLYIGEAPLAFLFGVIIGPYGAGLLDPQSWAGGDDNITNTITLEVTRVVLAIGVFAIGVELPKAYMKKHWKSLAFLLGPVMTWGWFVSAGLIYAFIPGLNFLSSLAVAACLTPTDPILAAAVVGGKWANKHVPAHLRHLLAAESGCNDGAAFPFLFIALYLTLDKSVGLAIRDWFVLLWIYQVLLGTVLGVMLGFAFRYLMKFCERNSLIDRQSYVAQYISLALLTIGVTTLLGSDDLLAAFACGTAFAWDGFFNRQTEESVFSSVIDLLFNIACFVYIGAWMPFNTFVDEELGLSIWRLIVIALLVLLLRRLPVMIALYRWIPDVKTFREAVFSGHFGPIGVGAVFISTLATEYIEHDSKNNEHSHQIEQLAKTIQPIVAFMVLCSIVIHGLSIPGFSLGRRVHTVSRTWSRHSTLPDWTNQARLVNRGAADIVINRDSAMERGEIQSEKLQESGTLTPPSPSVREKTTDEGDTVREQESTKYQKSGDISEEARPDTPPDGTAEYVEWREPHHTVIERQESPGEDVEVEVLPSENSNGHPNAITKIRQSLGILEGVRKTTEEMEGHAGEKLGEKLEEIESRVKDVLTEHDQKHSPAQRQGSQDDDEGWASDTEPQAADSDATNFAVSPCPRHDRAPKMKATTSKSQPVGSASRNRRRNSVRRTHVLPPRLSLSESSPDDTESRGRSHAQPCPLQASRPAPPSPSPSWRPGTPRRTPRPGTADSSHSLQNRRLQHLQALHSTPPSRDCSPTRSIRFADERSPRSPPQQADDGSPGEDALDQTRVTFELPKASSSKP